jgi:hypothetical protein
VGLSVGAGQRLCAGDTLEILGKDFIVVNHLCGDCDGRPRAAFLGSSHTERRSLL